MRVQHIRIIDTTVVKSGEELRQILLDANKSPELHTYVDYAHGVEGHQEIHGYEDWRLDRLKAPKAKYDPNGKFNSYVPIYWATKFVEGCG